MFITIRIKDAELFLLEVDVRLMLLAEDDRLQDFVDVSSQSRQLTAEDGAFVLRGILQSIHQGWTLTVLLGTRDLLREDAFYNIIVPIGIVL